MSALTDRIAAVHAIFAQHNHVEDGEVVCECEARLKGIDAYTRHVAEVTTEAVAREIEAQSADLRDQATALLTGELTTDQGRDLMRIYRGLTIAARIARGDQS